MILRLLLVPALTGMAFSAPLGEERIEHAGARFRVVRIEPSRVRVVWKAADGTPYRTFDRVRTAFSKQGKTVGFLMNGGIFGTGGVPCGLHVENGIALRPLTFADATGNFYLKPNGVVWIEKDHAFIATSESYAERVISNPKPVETAVQSGPLLLIDGKRHPAFKEGSSNKLHRNGVGVDGAGRLVFAITDRGQFVNFWDFAGLFLKLGCRNALFLDGDISQMAVNPDKLVQSNHFGAMFVVAE